VGDWLLPILSPDRYGNLALGHFDLASGAHVAIFFGAMVLGSILFRQVLDSEPRTWDQRRSQTESSPPDCRYPGSGVTRVLKRVLERYIPIVTVISGATVGALAAGADLIGTVGNASGTGVLLSVVS